MRTQNVMTSALTLTVLLLCIPVLAQAQGPAPGRVSRDWKRVIVDDLEAVGNASEGDLRRALGEVQRFRGTLLALLPGLSARSTQKTVLIVLRDSDSFGRFAPRDARGRRQQGVGGYFMGAPDANLMVLPMYAEREATYQTVFHEYTHYLVYRNMRHVPRWLNEGIAELYSTFWVDGNGRAVIGRTPRGRLAVLQGRALLPLERFLNPETSARLFENQSDTALFYAQAWAFVHFMTLGDKGSRQGQILKYLEALQTMSAADAAKTAFGSSLGQLDVELRRYTKQLLLPAIVLNIRRTGSESAERVEPLTEADALHLQGRLLVDVGATDEAEEMLTRALALDASHPGARLAMGRVHVRQGRHADGVRLLNDLAGQRLGDFDVQFFLAAALFGAGRYEESLKAYERAITLNPQSDTAWYGVSAAALALKRDAHSQAAMRHAQEHYSDPSRYFSRAQFALGIGRDDAAARDARDYLQLAGWTDDSAPYVAFIGAIAHWRLDQRAEADALLANAARAVQPKSWVAAVVQYLQGQLTDSAFLDRADDNGQRTEAHAYIGIRLLLAGRTDEGRKHLMWVKERGEKNYTEYSLALAELTRLDQR